MAAGAATARLRAKDLLATSGCEGADRRWRLRGGKGDRRQAGTAGAGGQLAAAGAHARGDVMKTKKGGRR